MSGGHVRPSEHVARKSFLLLGQDDWTLPRASDLFQLMFIGHIMYLCLDLANPSAMLRLVPFLPQPVAVVVDDGDMDTVCDLPGA